MKLCAEYEYEPPESEKKKNNNNKEKYEQCIGDGWLDEA